MVLFSVIIGGGVGLVVVTALLIGQAQAQNEAWRAIARERRNLAQRRRELISAAASSDCPRCRLRALECDAADYG